MTFTCDFHIHSCLSPCGDLTMSPSYIAGILKSRGVQIAALTDHNTALNCPAFGAACRSNGIIPLFGMEAQSSEEIHALCLFDGLDAALEFSRNVYELLPDVQNMPEKTGDQVYVNTEDEILGELEKYLITSIPMPMEDIAHWVHREGGIYIPAHVDRAAFSMSSQLGCIIDGPWDALEVVNRPGGTAAGGEINTRGYPLTQSSDAHYPEHIARRTFRLDIDDPMDGTRSIISLIRKALQKLPG